MRFIGIHGQAGCGKSTAAALVCRALAQRGWNPVRRSFADPIRAVAEALTGTPQVLFHDQECKAGMSPFCAPNGRRLSNRCMLQLIGGALRETFQQGVLRAVELRLPEKFADGRTVVVFDDLRMPAERLWLQDRQAKLLLVVGRSVALVGPEASDITEVQLPRHGFDAVIDNAGAIDGMEFALETWVGAVFGACPGSAVVEGAR